MPTRSHKRVLDKHCFVIGIPNHIRYRNTDTVNNRVQSVHVEETKAGHNEIKKYIPENILEVRLINNV